MILYSLRSLDSEWKITKFDDDLNPESSYIVSSSQCECPQWTRRQTQCRHMKMLPMMLERADSEWFFCYEDAQWYELDTRNIGVEAEPGDETPTVREALTVASTLRASPKPRVPDKGGYVYSEPQPKLRRRIWRI